MLRRFGAIGIAIIILWLLSPLGGQSSLRILQIVNTSTASQGRIHYFNTSDLSSMFSSGDEDPLPSIVRAILQASFLEPDTVTNSPVDQWNNVKIPKIDDLSPFTDAAPDNPWINVNQTAHPVWSSLTGIMIQELPTRGNSTFTLESSYIDLQCSNSVLIESDDPDSMSSSYKNYFKNELQCHNGSWPFESRSPGIPGNNTSSFFMDLDSPQIGFGPPPRLLYASKYFSVNSSTDLFTCTMGLAQVESEVTCHGQSCAAS